MRLVISTNVVPPYRISLFAALAEELQGAGDQLTVIAWTPDMVGRHWEVDAQGCGFELRYAGTKPLYKMLSTTSCDALISTGFGPESMLAAAIGRRRKMPTLIWSEAIGGSGDYDDNPLRLVQRRVLGRASAGMVVPGAAAAAYSRRFNSNLLTLRNTIDLDIFAGNERELRTPSVVTVGQLRRYRNHHLLVEPIRRAIADGYYERWVLVGDGPERIPLVAACRAALGDKFTHVPHASTDGVASLLQRASCFASIPTRDIWGFAVQEAIMTGVPVVVSPNVGCVADLVYPKSGGYITATSPAATTRFAADVYQGLAQAASWDTQDQSAAAATELRRQWTPKLAAHSFVAQLRSILADRA